MREAPNCAQIMRKRLVVRICAGNRLKCEYVRETAKSAIPHPPHLIVASERYCIFMIECVVPKQRIRSSKLIIYLLHIELALVLIN